MKKNTALWMIIYLLIGSALPAQTLSGVLDTKISLGAGAGVMPDFFYGAEEYANLRLKIPVGEYADIYGAFNLIAAAGSSAELVRAASANAVIGGENYAAAMELERLYVQLSTDALGLSVGLLRIPFGYSLAWTPMDFLNPHNLLEPDARLRGVLGITASWFFENHGDMKFLVFAAAPRDPIAVSGGGTRVGLSWDGHWRRASVQLLYCFENPYDNYPQGLHRMGLSLKAELGLTAEFLYTLNPASPAGINGFAASFGADYSFFDGKLYLLAEYLYSGDKSAAAQSAAQPLGHTGSHYLYALGSWKWSDFSGLSLGCAANLEDLSCTSLVAWEYEFVQGMVLYLRAQVPLDRRSFNAGNPGELGPLAGGYYALFRAGLKIRF